MNITMKKIILSIIAIMFSFSALADFDPKDDPEMKKFIRQQEEAQARTKAKEKSEAGVVAIGTGCDICDLENEVTIKLTDKSNPKDLVKTPLTGPDDGTN